MSEISIDLIWNLDNGEIEKMKERLHRYCFIANALSNEVEVTIS